RLSQQQFQSPMAPAAQPSPPLYWGNQPPSPQPPNHHATSSPLLQPHHLPPIPGAYGYLPTPNGCGACNLLLPYVQQLIQLQHHLLSALSAHGIPQPTSTCLPGYGFPPTSPYIPLAPQPQIYEQMYAAPS